MRKYKARIHGSNYLMQHQGARVKVGFSTIKEVEAESHREAMSAAIQLVGDEALEMGFFNTKKDRPKLFAINAYPIDMNPDDHSPFTVEQRKTIVEAESALPLLFSKGGFLFHKEGQVDRWLNRLFQCENIQWDKT